MHETVPGPVTELQHFRPLAFSLLLHSLLYIVFLSMAPHSFALAARVFV